MNELEVKKRTELGIDENMEGALAYFLGLLTGLLILILEKDNKFVRFHAMQSILTNIGVGVFLIIVGSILMFIPVIGWILDMLLYLGALLLWLFLMYKAFNKETYKLPVIGDLAAKQVGL